jgi:ferredoxin
MILPQPNPSKVKAVHVTLLRRQRKFISCVFTIKSDFGSCTKEVYNAFHLCASSLFSFPRKKLSNHHPSHQQQHLCFQQRQIGAASRAMRILFRTPGCVVFVARAVHVFTISAKRVDDWSCRRWPVNFWPFHSFPPSHGAARITLQFVTLTAGDSSRSGNGFASNTEISASYSNSAGVAIQLANQFAKNIFLLKIWAKSVGINHKKLSWDRRILRNIQIQEIDATAINQVVSNWFFALPNIGRCNFNPLGQYAAIRTCTRCALCVYVCKSRTHSPRTRNMQIRPRVQQNKAQQDLWPRASLVITLPEQREGCASGQRTKPNLRGQPSASHRPGRRSE